MIKQKLLKIYPVVFCVFIILSPVFVFAGVAVVGGLNQEKTASPGETYEGTITLKNTDDKPREAKIYLTDYLFYADGRNIYGPPGKNQRSNARWISFSPRSVIVSPRGTGKVHYSVKVPQDLSLSGTYWSMCMVEGLPQSADPVSQPEKDKTKLGIKQIMRYGVQIVTQINSTGTGQLTFLNTKFNRDSAKGVLEGEIENNGERLLKSQTWVELYDKNGVFSGKFEAGRSRIYPGTSVRYKANLGKLTGDDYKALIVGDCGGEDVFGITFKLKLENTPPAAPAAPESAGKELAKPLAVPVPPDMKKTRLSPAFLPSSMVVPSIVVILVLILGYPKRMSLRRAKVFIVSALEKSFRQVKTEAPQAKISQPAAQAVLTERENINIFRSVENLVSDTNFLALNARIIFERSRRENSGPGEIKKDVKGLVVSVIESLDQTIVLIEDYLKSREKGGYLPRDYSESIKLIGKNYTELADAMVLIAHSAEEAWPDTAEKAHNGQGEFPLSGLSKEDLFLQAVTLREVAGKLGEITR